MTHYLVSCLLSLGYLPKGAVCLYSMKYDVFIICASLTYIQHLCLGSLPFSTSCKQGLYLTHQLEVACCLGLGYIPKGALCLWNHEMGSSWRLSSLCYKLEVVFHSVALVFVLAFYFCKYTCDHHNSKQTCKLIGGVFPSSY